jgi:hypothetical protein
MAFKGPEANVLHYKRCVVCEEPLYHRGGKTCCRECLMVWAAFCDFTVLQSVLINARWAGAPSQAEMAREYYRQRMWDGIRRLGHSEDLLAEVLCEIIEEMEEVETAS